MEAINILKQKIKDGKEVGDKEFNSIMLSNASKSGLDQQKGTRPNFKKQSAIGQIKQQNPFPKAKKGETGRIGKGRFNRTIAQERSEKS